VDRSPTASTAQGRPLISLTTASEAVHSYVRFCAQHATGVQRTLKRNARDGIHTILHTKGSAQKLAAQLHHSNRLSMKRKQAAADSPAPWSRPMEIQRKSGRMEWTQEKDGILLAAPAIAHAAVKWGHTANACQARRRRLLHDVADRPDRTIQWARHTNATPTAPSSPSRKRPASASRRPPRGPAAGR
jgi:hypothetical protein